MSEFSETHALNLGAEECPANGIVKIFTCNSNKDLAERVTEELGLKLGKSSVTTFTDGEIYTRIDETVRGCDCYIIQSISPPVNNNLMELLIMIDAMRRASARHITAVIPYFAYARQDRKIRPREPITAKLVANMIVTAGAQRVLVMDLHSSQVQGFFDIPVDNLMGAPILKDYYREMLDGSEEETVVVSPDVGGIKRANAFAKGLGLGLAIVDKRRTETGETQVANIIGDIKGKRVILTDDVISTGGTLCNDADELIKQGATEVYACCTHAILSGNATQRIQDSCIKELVVLDTVFLPMEKRIPKIKVISASTLFSEAIFRIHRDEPLSMLYNKYMI